MRGILTGLSAGVFDMRQFSREKWASGKGKKKGSSLSGRLPDPGQSPVVGYEIGIVLVLLIVSDLGILTSSTPSL